MKFRLFHEAFPKIAEKETRFVHIFNENSNVPLGQYGWFPSYCEDKSCDCRRAFISVLRVDRDKPTLHAATISYGWERMSFYSCLLYTSPSPRDS